MARRVIGVDVGTNAVTVAEIVTGAAPKLTAFGQVALARDAMREGEIADDEAVVSAIKRLRVEVGLRKAPVRVGFASPRLVVRQIEMPVMSPEDLAGALRFQAADLIPIPLEEAVLDFAILDTVEAPGAEPVMRVLLAAAQRETVQRLVNAVERAGLPVTSVDIVPLALIRSLGTVVRDNGGGAEGIVDIGGGVTSIVVHEFGTPRFVRMLATGGRALTDAVAAALDMPVETAESLKRQIGVVDDHVVDQARTALERPLGVLIDEIRSSLDYYRNQPGASRLLRVQLTGGGAQLVGLPTRLAELLGVPVDLAQPREHLQVADIGFAPEELDRLDPYLPVASGLALGDEPGLASMNLLPSEDGRRVGLGSSRKVIAGAAAGVVLVGALGALTVMRGNEIDDAKQATQAADAETARLQAQLAQLGNVTGDRAVVQRLQAQLASVLSGDVSWARMLNEIARTMPNNVWLTNFSGTATAVAAAPTGGATATPTTIAGASSTTTTTLGTASPGTGISGSQVGGQVRFTAVGLDFPAVADWLKRIQLMQSLSDLWVSQATKGALGDRDVVDFQSTANVTNSARSDRLEKLQGGAR